jgi:hypothetical protein
VDLERLPRSLLERFAGEPQEQLVALLRQLSPLSVTSAERGHRARRMRLEMDPQRTPAAAAERPK